MFHYRADGLVCGCKGMLNAAEHGLLNLFDLFIDEHTVTKLKQAEFI